MRLAEYFDILAPIRQSDGRSSVAVRGGLEIPVSQQWLPQWAALFLGILVQPFFSSYQTTHQWQAAGLWGWALASLIIAVVVFPAVYKGAFDPAKPWLIQIGPIFASGLGWNTLFQVAVKAATGPAGH